MIKIAVTTGKGRAFYAGADIKSPELASGDYDLTIASDTAQ